MKQTKINFAVTSYEGHSEYSLLPKQALAKIKKMAKEENKWTFIGGEVKNTELLKESDLVQAQEDELEIMLVNAIAGGCNDVEKPVEINFETVKKISGITIDIEEDDYVKRVTVAVGTENLIDIVHDREVIVKAIERKLEEFAQREIDGLRTALNV